MHMHKSVVYVFNDTDHHGFEVCIKNDRTVGSLGIWVGDNPFDFVVPITLCQIIITIIASRFLYHVLRPLKTPRFVCNVLGGILFGPTIFGHNHALLETLFPLKQATFLLTLSKVGASYFVFINALKMDVITTLRTAKRCWRFGVIPFFCSYFVTSILLTLYKPYNSKETIPNVFTVSSFAVVYEALTELNLVTTELGQIALSSAMISEIMQWITIGIIHTSKDTIILSAGYLICIGLFLLLCCFVIRPAMKSIVQKTPTGKAVKELYVVLILLGVLVVAGMSDIIGLYFIVGPTLYGLVMPNGPPLATTIIEKSEFVISEFLMPFFFIYIGINTNISGMGDHWKVVVVFQMILFVGFLVKVLTCMLISPTYNIKPKHGAVLGLLLSIKGIMELIFYSRLKKIEVINDEIFSQMVLYVVLMTAACVPLIKSMYKHRSRVLNIPSIHEGLVRMIQNIHENSQFNIISCVHNDENVHSMIALLETCNPTVESPVCVHVIHLIELLGKSTPILLPMNIQKKKSLSTNYPNTNHIFRAFENYSNNSNGPVTIVSYVNVAPYNSMHDAICNLAEDKLVHFIIIPFHENDQSFNTHMGTSIRNLNTSFQARARCTVGILVDRYSQLSRSTSKLSFHIGIFFMGGPDDREALALGIRMLERPNMNVTLFHFVKHNNISSVDMDKILEGQNEEEDKLESTLDESLLDEFKAKKINSDNVTCHEVVVKDYIQVLEAIRDLENDDYDLVMVGKRHDIGELTDEEMSNFMDNADQLGIFGDMLASTEFCNGRVSVLVMQCGEKTDKTNILRR